nr:uncharacterized protein LOC117985281 [Maniola hyperantus]
MDTFEFANHGEVTFSKSGKIGPLEKNVRIPIVIPQCSDLTYIRVDVDNPIAPPFVKMDYDMSTVVINYRPLQYSISNYVVTAKSVPNPDCNISMRK